MPEGWKQQSKLSLDESNLQDEQITTLQEGTSPANCCEQILDPINTDTTIPNGWKDENPNKKIPNGWKQPDHSSPNHKKKPSRGAKMKEVRTKMESTRKTMENQRMRKELRNSKETKPRKETIESGTKIIEASRSESKDIQETGELVIVGADAEALYPSLKDIEVAIVCFNAILESDISITSTIS